MTILEMTVNNKSVNIEIDPGEMLSSVLREKLGLTGTKIGCGEGECGACTVLVDGVSVDSCIYPALKARGRAVVTIEGLAQKGQLHPIQDAFVEQFASQCGYCTPGFIMSSHALLSEQPAPSKDEILEGLSGNLCRCTGYYQIISAVEAASRKIAGQPEP